MTITQDQLKEIEELRNNKQYTRRSVAQGAEDVLYKPFEVLDHGFVRLIDYMGDDSAIVQAARVSYGKGTKSMNNDAALINYLMHHRHTTPFEMVEAKFHVKLPIFIARQWIRHRTANINEYSARYSVLEKEFYIPSADHICAQSKDNKQGRGEIISPEQATKVLDILLNDANQTYTNYEKLMNVAENGEVIDPNSIGIARELARMNLTLNTYTQMYWKIDLHNLFHFLKLRVHPHAQYEIRVYAEQMLEIIKNWLPLAYNAFEKYRMNGVDLSDGAVNVIRKMLSGEKVTQETSGLSKREWNELAAILRIN